MNRATTSPVDFCGVDDSLTPEEQRVRDTAAEFVDRDVLPVIREAVASLPHGHPSLRLRVHPDVAARVDEALRQAPLPSGDWQVQPDATVDPGGCRIETATGEIDATMPARWRAVVAALGSEARWVQVGETVDTRAATGASPRDARRASSCTTSQARNSCASRRAERMR